MTAPKPKTLVHEDALASIEVDRDQTDSYASQGWTEKGDSPKGTTPAN